MNRLVLAVAVILCASAHPARADESDKARADEVVRQGMELGRAGKLGEAIAAFKRAEAIYPRAVNDCNIGLAYARQKQWVQAHLFLVRCRERWSREETRPIDAWVEQRIKESLSALRAGAFAPVDIRVSPADAVVHVSAFEPDETFVGGRIVWLPHGSATVAARRDGYRSKEIAVAVAGTARQTVSIELDAIEADPPERDPVVTPPDRDPVGTTSPPADPTPPVTTPVDTPHTTSKSSGAGPWLAVGAGVALGVAGGVMHVVAAETRGDLVDLEKPDSGASQADIDDKRDSFLQQRNVTIGLYTAGGIALGVGLYLLLRSDGDDGERKSGPMVGASPTRGGGAVWLSWEL